MEKDFGKRAFVMVVTAEWCGHCRVFKPEIAKAIANLKKKGKASKVDKAGKQKEKQRGGSNNTAVVQMSDMTAGHIMEVHGGTLLGKMLHSQVGGFPTCIAVGSIQNNNTMAISHFDKERTAMNFKDFVESTYKL